MPKTGMIGACSPLSWSVVSTFTDTSMLPFTFNLRPGASVSFLIPSGSATSDSSDVTPPIGVVGGLSPVADLPSAEDVAPQQIHQQRRFRRGFELEARRVLNLVPGFDGRTPRVEADDEINAVTPRFEPCRWHAGEIVPVRSSRRGKPASA